MKYRINCNRGYYINKIPSYENHHFKNKKNFIKGAFSFECGFSLRQKFTYKELLLYLYQHQYNIEQFWSDLEIKLTIEIEENE